MAPSDGGGRPPGVPHGRRGGDLRPPEIRGADVGERPGFMAGGELRVDAYYETVKRRIKKIRDELEAIRRERAVRRSVRKERGYHLVALAGYANAGKSSLLNVLSDERVLVDDRMFSTLATTTRSLTGTRRRAANSTGCTNTRRSCRRSMAPIASRPSSAAGRATANRSSASDGSCSPARSND